MKLDASPNARKRMTDRDRLLVRMAQPDDYFVRALWLGGWYVNIQAPRPRREVGKSPPRMFTFGGGFAAAMKDMTERAA